MVKPKKTHKFFRLFKGTFANLNQFRDMKHERLLKTSLDGSQGDQMALGHPQRPRQAQPWGVQQVPFIFIKMNI